MSVNSGNHRPRLERNPQGNSFLELIDEAAQSRLPITRSHRLARYKFNIARHIYKNHAHFFIPVHANSKVIAWQNPRFIPVEQTTVKEWTLRKLPKKKARKAANGKKYRPHAYDLAIRTGAWQLGERNTELILCVLDIDDWDKVPKKIRRIINQYPTLVNQTRKGFHFFYWAPKWYAKSGSSPGIADWLSKGSIAVLTGADRVFLTRNPIATLSDEDADKLYKFATHPPEPDYSRWSVSVSAGTHYTEVMGIHDFEAHEGERNYRINAILYRHRYKSDEELIDLALDLASRCYPPYREKEAIAVAKSIIRHRYRFPTGMMYDKYQNEVPVPYNEDYRYVRLAYHFPKTNIPFTRADYEKKLQSRGWKRDKRGRIEVARRDIEHNLKLGTIRIAGKGAAGEKGGNRPYIYERIEDCNEDFQYILPGKVTHKNLRLSSMMFMLPDQKQEVVRETIRRYLGLKDDGTISRYSNDLQNAAKWGEPLIEKIVRKPYIFDQRLNPRSKKVTEWPIPKIQYRWLHANFVRYRPSVYQRTRYYHKLIYEQPAKLPQDTVPQDYSNEIAAKLAELQSALTATTATPNPTVPPSTPPGAARFWRSAIADAPERDAKASCHIPCNKMAKSTTTSSFEDEKRACSVCKIPIDEDEPDTLCKNCTERRLAVEKSRLQLYSDSENPMREDYCCFCDTFFMSDQQPMRGVCTACEQEHFPNAEPIRIRYCPHCNAKVHSAHYTEWKLPKTCPSCHRSVKKWSFRPAPLESKPEKTREEELPGYPVNYYINDIATLFEFMSDQYEKLMRWEFQDTFTEIERKTWTEYCGTKFKDVPCEICGELVRVDVDAPDTVKKCVFCEMDEERRIPLPEAATDILEFYGSPLYVQAVKNVFKLVFGKEPLKQDDLDNAIDRYGCEWVEFAIRAAGHRHKTKRAVKGKKEKKNKRVYTPFPFTLAILKNWEKQGGIPRTDRERIRLERIQELIGNEGIEGELEFLRKQRSIYSIYNIHFARLTSFIAHQLARAEKEYGEVAVREALYEAVSRDIRKWSYCRAILTRRRRDGEI